MYSGKFIKERPKVARDFMQAYVKGVKYFHQLGWVKTKVPVDKLVDLSFLE